jgi:hypothetical protein
VPPSVATGAVRSYRTLSPLPSSRLPATLRRFAFCCTFRGLAPPRRYLAPHPPEPGLSSPPIEGLRLPWKQRLPSRLPKGIVHRKQPAAVFFVGIFHWNLSLEKSRVTPLFSDVTPGAGGKKRGFCRLRGRVATPGRPIATGPWRSLATGLATRYRFPWRDGGLRHMPRSGARRSAVRPAQRRGSAAAP